MAIPVTPKPPFPNVPVAPGVPPVRRQIGTTVAQVVSLASDAISIISLFNRPKWGLFDDAGQPAFATASDGLIATVVNFLQSGPQSVGEVEYRNDSRISSAPQEQGAFVSYNKAASPFNGRVSYILSGTQATRAAFLGKVLSAQSGDDALKLFALVMPEGNYPSVNVVHHDFRRTAQRGVTMFVVDVWVEEVRITATAAFTDTKATSGADQVNGGTVQPQVPTASQQAAGPAGGLT